MKTVFLCLTAISVSLSSLLAGAASAKSLEFKQSCKPELANTHSCLEELPSFSYNLILPSDYSQALCLSLGAWTGENRVVVEWDGLQISQSLSAQGEPQFLQPERRSGRSSGILLYSEQPIAPHLIQGSCASSERQSKNISKDASKGNASAIVTPLQWPVAAGQDSAEPSSQISTRQ